MRCDGDYILRIFGAKYGRLEPGSSICPHENITELNCQAPNVLLKMTVRCGNKHRCTIRADHTVFGDPCPGTYKYLDVIYGCGKSTFIGFISFTWATIFQVTVQSQFLCSAYTNENPFSVVHPMTKATHSLCREAYRIALFPLIFSYFVKFASNRLPLVLLLISVKTSPCLFSVY